TELLGQNHLEHPRRLRTLQRVFGHRAAIPNAKVRAGPRRIGSLSLTRVSTTRAIVPPKLLIRHPPADRILPDYLSYETDVSGQSPGSVSAMESSGGAKPSKVEATKIASQYLRTFVADEVQNGLSHFSEDAATVLKFHGSYQQDDRDHRTQLKREGKEKDYQFMVRIRIVGGRLSANQYLTAHKLAQTVGNGTLRITTRQEFQLHGVLKEDLPSTIRTINEALLSTLAACGDVERNVLSCPAPIRDAIRDAM